VSYDPRDSVSGAETVRLARSLRDTGKFANPFPGLDTGPSAHLSPVFPAFLALLMKLFGDKSSGIYAIKLAAALVLSLQLALYPVFSRILGMGEINGIIGASIWIVAKPRLVHDWEPLYVAILLAVACCLYRRYIDEEAEGRSRLAWPLGCLVGFLILTGPTVAPIYATWLGWEMWRQKYAFFKVSLLPLVLLPVLIIAPWTIRNYLIFHSFPIIRDDLGLELSVSNNDCARFGFWENMYTGCFGKFHPYSNVSEARKLIELGEVKYNDLQLQKALRWINGHPNRFIKLTLQRFFAFWIPVDSFAIHDVIGRRLERFTIYLMTLLSGLGLVILYQRDSKSAAIFLSLITVFPLVYYTVEFVDRYRYPIMWATFLLGGVPITTCAQRLWKTFCNASPAVCSSKPSAFHEKAGLCQVGFSSSFCGSLCSAEPPSIRTLC
jgi:hypothetical protein